MSELLCSECKLPMHFARSNWYHVNEDGSKSLWPGKCSVFAGAIAAIPTTVNKDPEPPSLEELRTEAEEKYQELCRKAQIGCAATLDELADVAGIMVKIVDAILEER